MYIRILLDMILGFVNIEIEGYFVERFINICISKKILLWNIKRDKSTIAHMNIGVKDFRKAIKIAKETKCRIRINKKIGVPFILHKYRKRKIFLYILVLMCILIFVLSNFVWNIQIEGNNNITREEIVSNLEDEGLKIGVFKNKIDTKKIISDIRLKRNDLAWVGIEIKGTNAIVKIVEADKKPDIIDEEDFCNIVATKPGIVVKVNAINGTPLVKEGDTIKEGSTLIGGWLEGKYTGIRYVHANGSVKAKVWYSR